MDINIFDDNFYEGDENIFLYLSSGVGVLSPFSEAEVIIISNDSRYSYVIIVMQGLVG